MSIEEISEILKKLGLDTSGTRSELIEKLASAIGQKIINPKDIKTSWFKSLKKSLFGK